MMAIYKGGMDRTIDCAGRAQGLSTLAPLAAELTHSLRSTAPNPS